MTKQHVKLERFDSLELIEHDLNEIIKSGGKIVGFSVVDWPNIYGNRVFKVLIVFEEILINIES